MSSRSSKCIYVTLLIVFCGIIYLHYRAIKDRATLVNNHYQLLHVESTIWKSVFETYLQERKWDLQELAKNNLVQGYLLERSPGKVARNGVTVTDDMLRSAFVNVMCPADNSNILFSSLMLLDREESEILHIGTQFSRSEWPDNKKHLYRKQQIKIFTTSSNLDVLEMTSPVTLQGHITGWLVGQISLQLLSRLPLEISSTEPSLNHPLNVVALKGPSRIYTADLPKAARVNIEELLEVTTKTTNQLDSMTRIDWYGEQYVVLPLSFQKLPLRLVNISRFPGTVTTINNMQSHIVLGLLLLLFVVFSGWLLIRWHSEENGVSSKGASLGDLEKEGRDLLLIQKGEQHEMMQGMLHSREISLHGWLESVPDLIFVQDVNLAIIDCNVTFEHFVGLAKSYIIGKSPKDIFTDPDKLKLVEKYSEEVIREGNVIQTEEAFRKKSGNTYFYNCVKAPLRSSGGYLEGVIGIFRNVTDNRWSTAGYNARKDQPALPMEAFPIGLWDVGVSLDGLNFQHVDTLLGYESGQFSDLDLKSYFNLVCLEDKRKITRKIGKFIKGRSDTFECEFRMRHKEGHWIWLLALGQNLGDNGGESRKAGGILLDITLRKNAETRLIHLNNTLEKAFAERTKELECAHSRLLNNEKMAAIGLLASGVAHELRNPINFIQMNFAILREYTEDLISLYDLQKKILKRFDDRQSLVLAEKIESEEKKINLKLMLSDMPSLFDETSKGFERVNHIVRAMRNFNRQNGEENFEEIAVNSCIEDTLIIARNEYKYFAEIETNLGNIPPVMANREQINQVFLNLILNAVQAIGSKGKSSDINGYIYIETTTDGNFIYCTIRDNGPGIHEDALSHVFEPFFTTKGSKGGTGLGLSISYDIVVNKHQGDFTVDNHVAGGAIFKICLPINPAADSSSGRSLDNV